MQYFDLVSIEYHTRNGAFQDQNWRENSLALERLVDSFKFFIATPKIISLDDEVYRFSNFTLPDC